MPSHEHEPVRSQQRFVHGRWCPVCNGCDDDPRGTGSRCYGFMSIDGAFAHCTRPEFRGALASNGADTFAHRLRGGGGHWHDDPTVRPFNVEDRTAAGTAPVTGTPRHGDSRADDRVRQRLQARGARPLTRQTP